MWPRRSVRHARSSSRTAAALTAAATSASGSRPGAAGRCGVASTRVEEWPEKLRDRRPIVRHHGRRRSGPRVTPATSRAPVPRTLLYGWRRLLTISDHWTVSIARSVPPPNEHVSLRSIREYRRAAVNRRRSPFRRAPKRCAPPAAPVIDLGAGEPDFPTPAFVMEAAHRALDAGCTRYTQVEGIAPLREAIAERAHSDSRRDVDRRDDVVVSAGTKQALFNACFSLFAGGRRGARPDARMDELLRDAGARARDAGGRRRIPRPPTQGDGGRPDRAPPRRVRAASCSTRRAIRQARCTRATSYRRSSLSPPSAAGGS